MNINIYKFATWHTQYEANKTAMLLVGIVTARIQQIRKLDVNAKKSWLETTQ